MTRLHFISLLIVITAVSCGSSKNITGKGGTVIIKTTGSTSPGPADKTAALKRKYATSLEISPEQVTNIALYEFIDHWIGTPYKWGGTDKRGIDCSAFIQRLFDSVYQIQVPRTSLEQFYTNWVDKFRTMSHLSEGDLIFFKTIGNNVVSHVGLYLDNGYFINSSSTNGVSIASITDPYWKRKIVGAGRINIALIKN